MASSSELLEKLAQAIRKCTRCKLSAGRINPVPGEGSPEARVMFIGEGPGAREDQAGRPFVGAAGKVLDRLLKRVGLTRQEVFITNIVKCRPPNNRTPLPEEVDACNDYLLAQIAAIRPEIIVCVGSPATRALLGADMRITREHGKPRKQSGIIYLPVYHPAAALHNENLQDALLSDFEVLRQVLAGEWQAEPAPTPPPEVESSPPLEPPEPELPL